MTRLTLAMLAALILIAPEMSAAAGDARGPRGAKPQPLLPIAKQQALRNARQGAPAWRHRTGQSRQTTFIQDM